MTEPQAASIDPAEVANFTAMAADWWNPAGKFRPLHQLGPVRLAYIRDRLIARFGLDSAARRPLAGLRLLDIGCGGGLIAEPMARLGATVVGVDAAEKNIGVARAHAAETGIEVDYRCTSAEALADAGEQFDAVLALEVVEHVADLDAFLEACSRMVRPGGLLVAATLNRTPLSWAAAIVAAEYVLRWLPRGTHDWCKFLKPHELARGLRDHGLTLADLRGMSFNPLRDSWRLSHDTSINYLLTAEKPALT